MIFYFSGTGNSKWIADQVSHQQHENLIFIPDALKNGMLEFSLKENEMIGFVFPVYSWGPPEIVLRFISQLILKGYQQQYLFFVCSCGDDIGLTHQVLIKALAVKGWTCYAGFSVIMPNNYVLLPGFNVDNKNLEEEKLNNAVASLKGINNLIRKRECLFSCKKGSFPFIKTWIINPLFNRFQMSPKHFYATDTCVACKRCERICPVDNITVKGDKPVWKRYCTSCLACYHVCPQQAVQYGKRTKNKGQYLNPHFIY